MNELLMRPGEATTHTGVLAQLEQTDNSDTTKGYMCNLKRRARYHGYSLMKQVLVDYIKGMLETPPRMFKYVLSISQPCGESVNYETFDDIPDGDVPCSCGNPEHWFIRYRDLRI